MWNERKLSTVDNRIEPVLNPDLLPSIPYIRNLVALEHVVYKHGDVYEHDEKYKTRKDISTRQNFADPNYYWGFVERINYYYEDDPKGSIHISKRVPAPEGAHPDIVSVEETSVSYYKDGRISLTLKKSVPGAEELEEPTGVYTDYGFPFPWSLNKRNNPFENFISIIGHPRSLGPKTEAFLNSFTEEVLGAFNDHLTNPPDPTIDPIVDTIPYLKIIENIERNEMTTDFAHTKKGEDLSGQHAIVYGSISGKDLKLLLFELSNLPQDQIIVTLQQFFANTDPSLRRFLLPVIAYNLVPENLQTLSSALSVYDQSERQELLIRLMDTSVEQRTELAEGLRGFNDMAQALFDRNKNVLRKPQRPSIEGVDPALIEILYQGAEKKWKKVHFKFTD